MKRKAQPPSGVREPARQGAISGPLLAWYERFKRRLPWRDDPTPYRVWVSEMMLQQTRVEVVIPRYLRFLERFPDLKALAAAPEEAVLAEWSGLGYYRRARALHRAARVLMEDHGGEFPRDPAGARSLPGVGPYTAGAVLSIAYNLPLPILDGNVARVLSRLFRIAGDPRAGKARDALWALAEELIPEGQASSFNQALMELGALVCLPASPRCGRCPLADACAARKAGDAERYPEIRRGRAAVAVSLLAAVIERRGRCLLERRGQSGEAYLRGMWGFPLVEDGAGRANGSDAGPLVERLRERWGLRAQAGPLVGVFRHSITFRRITLRAFRLELPSKVIPPPHSDGGKLEWIALERLGRDLPASSLALKVKRALEANAGSSGSREGSHA